MISHYSEMFRRIIKNGNYEKYVMEIMNKSKTIFNNIHVSPNKEQSHGESDFVDQDGNKYEAKLIIDKKQGEIIGQSKNDIDDWINDMIKECSEISDISSYMDNCSFVLLSLLVL